MTIESTLSCAPDFKSLLLAHLWSPLHLEKIPPTVQASMIAWRAFIHSSVYNKANTDVFTLLSSLELLLLRVRTKTWQVPDIHWVNDILNAHTPTTRV